jgi:hypothetical protein
MNQQLQQIIEDSYECIPHERDWDAYTYTFNHQTFAHNLIKKCAQIARTMEQDGRNHIDTKILDYFGVEP